MGSLSVRGGAQMRFALAVICLLSICFAALAQKLTPQDGKRPPAAAPNPAGSLLGGDEPTRGRDERLQMPPAPTSNFSFIEGCWVTDPFKYHRRRPLGTSTYCFDKSGNGTLVHVDAYLGRCE